MDGRITWVPLYFFEEYVKVLPLSDSKAGKRYKDLLKTCIDGKTEGEFGYLVERSTYKMAKLRERAQKGAEKRWGKDASSNAASNTASNAEKKREEKKRKEKRREEVKYTEAELLEILNVKIAGGSNDNPA